MTEGHGREIENLGLYRDDLWHQKKKEEQQETHERCWLKQEKRLRNLLLLCKIVVRVYIKKLEKVFIFSQNVPKIIG